MNAQLTEKYKNLCAIIADKGRVALAFSGGVDSTLLLKAMTTVAPDRSVALLAATPLQPQTETQSAIDTAREIGAQLVVRHLNPLDWPEFVANPPDRCYHCKKAIYSNFKQHLVDQSDTVLMDGTNTDDLQEDRPGRRAIHELKIATPLVEAGLSKCEIRALSRSLQLPTWNKPSASCLATRIATGLYIDNDKLGVVARCEAHLHELGAQGCRVRLMGNKHAIIEFLPNDFGMLSDQETRKQINLFFKSMGFLKVFLDLSERKGILA